MNRRRQSKTNFGFVDDKRRSRRVHCEHFYLLFWRKLIIPAVILRLDVATK